MPDKNLTPKEPHFKITTCPTCLGSGSAWNTLGERCLAPDGGHYYKPKFGRCYRCRGIGKICAPLEPDKYGCHPQTGEKIEIGSILDLTQKGGD
jgi:hypothetical protein